MDTRCRQLWREWIREYIGYGRGGLVSISVGTDASGAGRVDTSKPGGYVVINIASGTDGSVIIYDNGGSTARITVSPSTISLASGGTVSMTAYEPCPCIRARP